MILIKERPTGSVVQKGFILLLSLFVLYTMVHFHPPSENHSSHEAGEKQEEHRQHSHKSHQCPVCHIADSGAANPIVPAFGAVQNHTKQYFLASERVSSRQNPANFYKSRRAPPHWYKMCKTKITV